jgi:hypothetical protein
LEERKNITGEMKKLANSYAEQEEKIKNLEEQLKS